MTDRKHEEKQEMPSKLRYSRLLRRHCRFFLHKAFGRTPAEFGRAQQLWALEDEILYRFRDWALLNQALTHKSYDNEMQENRGNHYERLEFLGDSVLDTAISHLLMQEYPDSDEGELSKRRSSLVNKKRLAQLARSLNVGKYVRLGKGEEQNLGRSKHSILACVYEALVGAVYLDGGYKKVYKVIQSHFNDLLSFEQKKPAYRDFKSRLQEHVQSTFRTIPEYNLVKESGPPHDRKFEIAIQINGKTYGTGKGKSKKDAQQRAAAATLKQLGYRRTSPQRRKTAKP
jgi:ribonuclease-3